MRGVVKSRAVPCSHANYIRLMISTEPDTLLGSDMIIAHKCYVISKWRIIEYTGETIITLHNRNAWNDVMSIVLTRTSALLTNNKY